MNRVFCFVSITLFAFMMISCEAGSRDNHVYKVSCVSLYDYYEEHDDTLLVGISGVNKETCFFYDGTKSVRLIMNLLDYDDYNEKTIFRSIEISEEQIPALEVFLDSCITKPLSKETDSWEINVGHDVILSYQSYLYSVTASFSSESLADLRISPKRLKEILAKAKEDN